MMRRHFPLVMVIAVMVTTTLSAPAWAQTDRDARLGGGTDIPPEVTIRLPQGGSLPPVHVIFADNPTDEPIEVEFRAQAPTGILVDSEWEEKTVPAQGSVVNHFSVRVGAAVAPGEYQVVVQLVRSDIESEPGRITSIPAIQAAFTVEVTGEAATVTVRSVSVHSGEPVAATITLSARDGERGWFEIGRAEGATLESRVAPGEFRAAVLLGEREVAAEEFTVEADQTLDVVIEVETVSFVVAAVRPVEERGRLVVAELVASVNNETEPIPGPNLLQATVSHNGVNVDTTTLDELTEVPADITEAAATYRPADGWQPGTYRFVFELVTPEFTLIATDQPVIEVPVPERFDLIAFLVALELREWIALAAGLILTLALITWLVRLLVVRRRRRHVDSGPPSPSSPPRPARRDRRGRSKRKPAQSSAETESWLEERIGPTTRQRPRWDDNERVHYYPESPPPPPIPSPPRQQDIADQPSGAHLARTPDHTPQVAPPPIPTPDRASAPTADADMANLVEALRVIQQLHDHGDLAPDWSITDATLIYWAMISPEIRHTLDAVGMSEEEYVTAMKRLFAHGLLRGKSQDE